MHNIGTNLLFANDVALLALCSAALIYLFNGSVHALIPLYAVGVFAGFSIAQLGMVRHWRRIGRGTIWKIAINVAGCIATSLVFCVVFVSKFSSGAWLLLPAAALIIFSMKRIKKHYGMVQEILKLDGVPIPDALPDKTMVILLSDINRATLMAIQFVRSLKPARIIGFHAAFTAEEGEAVRRKWTEHVPEFALEVRVAEFRDLIAETIDGLKAIDKRWEKDSLVVVIPELVPESFWHHFLHNQMAMRLRLAIEQEPDLNPEILNIPVKIASLSAKTQTPA